MIKSFAKFIKREAEDAKKVEPKKDEVLLAKEYEKCGGKDRKVEGILHDIDLTAYEYDLGDIEDIALKDNPNFKKSMALALALQFVKDNDEKYYKKLIILEIGDIGRVDQLNDVYDSYMPEEEGE
jgi:hypothetical protein